MARITAGNASAITDAAAAVVVMSEEAAKKYGLKPMAYIKAYASGGIDPAYMGMGVVPAVNKALKLAGLTLKDIDVFELNEAFAAQATRLHERDGHQHQQYQPSWRRYLTRSSYRLHRHPDYRYPYVRNAAPQQQIRSGCSLHRRRSGYVRNSGKKIIPPYNTD